MDVAYNLSSTHLMPMAHQLQQQQQKLQQQQHQLNQFHQQQPLLSVEEDDNLSAISQNSNCLVSNASAGTSTGTEATPPTISVRDMIKHYDIVAQQQSAPQAYALKRHSSHQTLFAQKGTLNGLNKFGSQSNVRQFIAATPMQDGSERFSKLNKDLRPNWIKKTDPDYSYTTSSDDRNAVGGDAGAGSVKISNSGSAIAVGVGSGGVAIGLDIGNPSARGNATATGTAAAAAAASQNFVIGADQSGYSHKSRRGRAVQNDHKDFGNTFRTGTPYNHLRMPSADYSEDAEPSVQKTYQSRTTISKTSIGVRIIIDIYFDQEIANVNPLDIVGRRIETEIPHSRILNEFQEQTLSSAPNSERF